MRRSHDRAALTEAIAAATARFQADIRRLGQTVLQRELDSLLATVETTPPGAGTRAEPMVAVPTRKQPAAAPRTRKQPAAVAAGTRAEPVIATIAEPTIATIAGFVIAAESVVATIAEPTIVELAVAAEPRAEPTIVELAVAAEPRAMESVTDEDAARREHARSRRAERREARAQRLQWRQERARQRRAATGTRGAAPAGYSASTLATGTQGMQWTRETIIVELASWMVGGAVVDESFVDRYGPPGLVAAALRVFGRFDVALNVAGQHVARLYPDSPPMR
jgi:hypothetical protein